MTPGHNLALNHSGVEMKMREKMYPTTAFSELEKPKIVETIKDAEAKGGLIFSFFFF